MCVFYMCFMDIEPLLNLLQKWVVINCSAVIAYLSFSVTFLVDTGTAIVVHVTLTGLDELTLVEKVDENHTGWIWIKNN